MKQWDTLKIRIKNKTELLILKVSIIRCKQLRQVELYGEGIKETTTYKWADLHIAWDEMKIELLKII